MSGGHTKLAPSWSMEPSIATLYTDGACLGNPGPGGWAALILDGGTERALWGCDPATTNQRMELQAALEGLRAIGGTQGVAVCSDSAYLVNAFLQGWPDRWQRNGWRNAKGEHVANRALWEELIEQAACHRVTWRKVAGHAGSGGSLFRRRALRRSGPPRAPGRARSRARRRAWVWIRHTHYE